MNTRTQKEMYDQLRKVFRQKDLMEELGLAKRTLYNVEKGLTPFPRKAEQALQELYDETFKSSPVRIERNISKEFYESRIQELEDEIKELKLKNQNLKQNFKNLVSAISSMED